jgi:proteasome alpha subunit
MLEDPYRWVEAIRNRREYVDDQLKTASPVVGCTYQDGLLLLTTTPGPRKLFEVYNQLAFAAIGHPADIEKLRKAVIDIAHLEAFNLSASDVSLHRLVHFGIGPLVKSAFDEIFRSPYLARVLVAELDPSQGQECFFTVDADGSFASHRDVVAMSGLAAAQPVIVDQLNAATGDLHKLTLEAALDRALNAWAHGHLPLADGDHPAPDDDTVRQFLSTALSTARIEAAVLDRTMPTKSKFRLLSAAEIEPLRLRYAGR